ncbi:hypothetical protein AGMMS50239_01940 [Bacteroidia bacterium]|nr:hypothetical protein AGMMS50239_01940 [Bacteroidia bacterium]
MKKTIFNLIVLVCISALSAGMQAQTKAFPTAEGFGQNATGGRGGKVVEVTNLLDDPTIKPEGSLRWALEQYPGQPITIVFRVNGARSNDINVLIDYVNNVTYNWGKTNSCYGSDIEKVSNHTNFVDNYYKPGPAYDGSKRSYFTHVTRSTNQTAGAVAKWYMSGNSLVGEVIPLTIVTSIDTVKNNRLAIYKTDNQLKISAGNETVVSVKIYNAVAKNGTGNFTTLQAVIDAGSMVS